MYDELAKTIDATRSRLEMSYEHTARHLAGSPFAAFAAGLHPTGVTVGNISAPSHASALCSMAATVYEVVCGFVAGNDPEESRDAARHVNVALLNRLDAADALGLLRTIGAGINTELTKAQAAGTADVSLLRHMMRSTYGNVEVLLK